MGVLRVSGVKVHSRENSPVGVLKVSGVKVHSREKQPSVRVNSVRS